MSLKKPGKPHRQASFAIGLTNQTLLGLRARLGDTLGASIFVTPCGANYGANTITISDRIGESFEYNDRNALPTSISICSVIKRVASTIRGKEIHVGHHLEIFRRVGQVAASHQALEFSVGIMNCTKISCLLWSQKYIVEAADYSPFYKRHS